MPTKLWKPGESGNPAGRPKGSRNKLAEDFLKDLRDAWKAHGKRALVETAQQKPEKFVEVVSKVLPKQIEGELKVNGLEDLLAGLPSVADAGDHSAVEEESPAVRH